MLVEDAFRHFEKVDVQNSIDLAGEALKETIHIGGEVARRGWKE
jgi:hypothetical protein